MRPKSTLVGQGSFLVHWTPSATTRTNTSSPAAPAATLAYTARRSLLTDSSRRPVVSDHVRSHPGCLEGPLQLWEVPLVMVAEVFPVTLQMKELQYDDRLLSTPQCSDPATV